MEVLVIDLARNIAGTLDKLKGVEELAWDDECEVHVWDIFVSGDILFSSPVFLCSNHSSSESINQWRLELLLSEKSYFNPNNFSIALVF